MTAILRARIDPSKRLYLIARVPVIVMGTGWGQLTILTVAFSSRYVIILLLREPYVRVASDRFDNPLREGFRYEYYITIIRLSRQPSASAISVRHREVFTGTNGFALG